jgi:hypothetical protein
VDKWPVLSQLYNDIRHQINSLSLQSILGELDLRKLTVFNSYAVRVKRIIVHNINITAIPSIEPYTCIQLTQLKNGLFPSLKFLIFLVNSLDEVVNLSVLPLLLRSKSLSEVTYCAEFYDELSDVLAILFQHANDCDLRHLGLQGALDHRQVNTLLQFRHLKSIALSLDMGSWTVDILDILSQLQLLDFQLILFPRGSTSIPERAPAPIAFPTLRKLTLVLIDGIMAGVLNILHSIVANQVQRIHLCTHEWSSRDDFYLLYQCLGNFTSLRKLTHILPMLELELEDIADQPVSLLTVIQPILALTHLEKLKLHFLKPLFSVSDDDVSRLALKCPSLKALILIPMPEEWHVDLNRPTFASLRCLATTCLNLVELVLPIFVDEQSLLLDIPIISLHRLQRLHLYKTSVDPALLLPLARRLDQIFPHLNDIEQGNGEDFPRLRDLVFNLCQPVRKDEQRRSKLAYRS